MTTLDGAMQCLARGDTEAALSACRAVIEREPRNVAALAMAGSAALAAGDAEEAVRWLLRALELAPRHPLLHVNLGEACRRAGRTDEALRYLRRATALKNDLPEAHYNLAMACLDGGAWKEASTAFETALRLRPDIDATGNYREALFRSGDRDGAIRHQRLLVAQNPANPAVHFELGALLNAAREPDEAATCFEEAHRLVSTHADTLRQLATTYVALGRIDDARSALDRLVDLGGETATAESQRLFLLQYHPLYDAKAILADARAWSRRYVDSAGIVAEAHARENPRDKRLRVGYVSSHFLDHVSGFFTLPLFRNHTRENFEIVCYSNVMRPDAVTALHQQWADLWRDTGGMTDAQLAEQIGHDRVDILVDLSMHAAGGRPLVFARKPAPVQMCWLAYPGTTGISALDYRISDPHLDPPGTDTSVYSERTLRLPDSFWCYDPCLPGVDVSELPSVDRGFITFACLNSVIKVNSAVLELWTRVLERVPHSKLLIQAPPGRPREAILAALAHGGSAARIEFVNALPRADYFRLYRQCDVGLDTFPAGGHTTSLDAFWMGVPVVTLAGRTVASRGGASIAMNLDLPELVATTPDDFVEKVVALVESPARLRELRAELRPRMEMSPLMNGRRFARNLEDLYRRAWYAHCEGRLADDEPQ
jgi:predicted O-linked N-acetylglucosamine transferase (SPINDLY family)